MSLEKNLHRRRQLNLFLVLGVAAFGLGIMHLRTMKAAAAQQTDKAYAPHLRGDALLLGKSEAASALIYWNGKRYVWLQQGD